MEIRNTFIYLLGFAGTGKLTIATELQRIVPSILVDNHSILNVLFRLIDTDGIAPLDPTILDKARGVRAIVLDTIQHLSKPNRNFIFTNELLADSDVDAELFREVQAVAAARNAALFPVRLHLSADELCKRIVSPDRKAKMKGINPVSARAKAETQKLFVPPCDYLDLDVTALTAAAAAVAILSDLNSRIGTPATLLE